MTLQEIQTLVDSVGVPSAYFQFTENTAQPPPFICWYLPESVNFHADGVVYATLATLVVELYTDEKDDAKEAAVEAALDGAELGWQKEETYIGGEELWMVTYTTEVFINECEQSEVQP